MWSQIWFWTDPTLHSSLHWQGIRHSIFNSNLWFAELNTTFWVRFDISEFIASSSNAPQLVHLFAVIYRWQRQFRTVARTPARTWNSVCTVASQEVALMTRLSVKKSAWSFLFFYIEVRHGIVCSWSLNLIGGSESSDRIRCGRWLSHSHCTLHFITYESSLFS